MDRTAINRALAKAMAYKQCGKDQHAAQWAAELLRLMELSDLIDVAAWERPQ